MNSVSVVFILELIRLHVIVVTGLIVITSISITPVLGKLDFRCQNTHLHISTLCKRIVLYWAVKAWVETLTILCGLTTTRESACFHGDKPFQQCLCRQSSYITIPSMFCKNTKQAQSYHNYFFLGHFKCTKAARSYIVSKQ